MNVEREDRVAGVQVHLLQVSQVRPALPWLCGLLSEAERVRAEGFVVPGAREEFVVGRAVLRLLLARRLHVPAAAVALCSDGNGKPRLAEPAPEDVAFNVSHSHGLIAVALGDVAAVGIDVERVDPDAPVVELAGVAWGAEASAALRVIASPAARSVAFFRQWVRFEAEAKFDGRGIAAMAKAADKALQENRKTSLHWYEFDVTADRCTMVGCVVVKETVRVEAPKRLTPEDLLALRDG